MMAVSSCIFLFGIYYTPLVLSVYWVLTRLCELIALCIDSCYNFTSKRLFLLLSYSYVFCLCDNRYDRRSRAFDRSTDGTTDRPPARSLACSPARPPLYRSPQALIITVSATIERQYGDRGLILTRREIVGVPIRLYGLVARLVLTFYWPCSWSVRENVVQSKQKCVFDIQDWGTSVYISDTVPLYIYYAARKRWLAETRSLDTGNHIDTHRFLFLLYLPRYFHTKSTSAPIL